MFSGFLHKAKVWFWRVVSAVKVTEDKSERESSQNKRYDGESFSEYLIEQTKKGKQ